MMSDKTNDYEEAFISYLDENNNKREGYFKVVHFDASFCKFLTHNNILVIPTCRILKVKYKLEEKEDERFNR
jgi:hypothetical protein